MADDEEEIDEWLEAAEDAAEEADNTLDQGNTPASVRNLREGEDGQVSDSGVWKHRSKRTRKDASPPDKGQIKKALENLRDMGYKPRQATKELIILLTEEAHEAGVSPADLPFSISELRRFNSIEELTDTVDAVIDDAFPYTDIEESLQKGAGAGQAVDEQTHQFAGIGDKLKKAAGKGRAADKQTSQRHDYTSGKSGGFLSDVISDDDIVRWAKSNGFSASEAAQEIEKALRSRAAARNNLSPDMQDAIIQKIDAGEDLSDFIDRVYRVVHQWEERQAAEAGNKHKEFNLTDDEIISWAQREGYDSHEAYSALNSFLMGMGGEDLPAKFKEKLQGENGEDFRDRVVDVVEEKQERLREATEGNFHDNVSKADIKKAAGAFREEGITEREAKAALWAMYGNNIQQMDWNPYHLAGLHPGQFHEIDEETYRGWVEEAIKSHYSVARRAGKAAGIASSSMSFGGDTMLPVIGGVAIASFAAFLLFVTFGMSIVYLGVFGVGAVALISSFSIGEGEVALFESVFVMPVWAFSTISAILSLTRSEFSLGMGVMAFGSLGTTIFIVKHLQTTEKGLEEFLESVVEWYLPESGDHFLQHEWAVVLGLGMITFPLQIFSGTTAITYLYLSALGPVTAYWMIRDDYGVGKRAAAAKNRASSRVTAEREKRGGLMGKEVSRDELSQREQFLHELVQEFEHLCSSEGAPMSTIVDKPPARSYAGVVEEILIHIDEYYEGEEASGKEEYLENEAEFYQSSITKYLPSAGEIKHKNLDEAASELNQSINDLLDNMRDTRSEAGEIIRSERLQNDFELCKQWAEEIRAEVRNI